MSITRCRPAELGGGRVITSNQLMSENDPPQGRVGMIERERGRVWRALAGWPMSRVGRARERGSVVHPKAA